MLSAAVLGLPGDAIEALQSLRENDRIEAELKFFGKTVKGLSREEFEEALYRALAGEYTKEELSRPPSVVWSIPEAEFDELYRKAQNEELKTAEAWEAELTRLRKRYGIPEPKPEEIPETETEGPETESPERPVILGARFLNHLDQSWINCDKVKPIEGYQDIACHADENSFVYRDADGKETTVSVAEFAEILENSPVLEKGKPIRLLSCEAGKDITKPPAQYLADHLQVRVMAPTDILYIYPDGKMKVGRDNDGYWRIFEPQEKKER